MIRAAILMFHPDPEKWVTGAYIKIGYFGDSDLRYQDEVHGPLILQADKTIKLIYTKYMKALIDYEGLQRIETYMFPVFFFLIQLRFCVTDDVFRKVADIDCAVNILQRQNRLGPCKILYLQTVFERFVRRFNPPSHMAQFRNPLAVKGFRWQICDERFFLPFW